MTDERVVRRRTVLLFGVGTTAVTALGLAAGRSVRSPQQLLADSAPPPRTVLTAPVERRVLSDTVVLRGVVGAQARVEATPAPVGQGRLVVTGVRLRSGQVVAAGAPLVEVSGRPLVALPGAVPAYRDLRPGTHGRDVEQLQAALRALGEDPGERAGTFGAGTKRALEAFYGRLGYPVPSTGEEGQRQLAEATEQVRLRERALDQAREAFEKAQDEAAERQVRFAEEDLAAARAQADALARTTGPMLPMSEVVFVPAFPARVEKIDAGVGDAVKTPLVTLSSGPLVVRARLGPADRALVKPELPVEIEAELLGATAKGTVTSVGDLEKAEDGTRYHPMVISPVGALDEKLNGADVRLSIVAAHTPEPVLVVPLAAVFAGADGRTGVLRAGPGGRQERVVVTVGATGDGFVAVTPTEGVLEPGDAVVVGAATP